MEVGTLDNRTVEELKKLRLSIHHGEKSTQKELDEIVEKWQKYKDALRPNEKDEMFTLVDNRGHFTKLIAPRWVCHLLSLRHRSTHALLQWQSPRLGRVFILQVRSWTKSDSPGCLDISVGGHVTGDNLSISLESTYREMEEELGITIADLKDGELLYQKGYESYDENEKNIFYNSEWRDVYLGEILTDGFDKIRFTDKEVVGLYLCPESEAKNLLKQNMIPLANALKYSLPLCL